MQNSRCHSYNPFSPVQTIEPIPNWPWNNRVAAPSKTAMEIGGLLSGNGRRTANTEPQIRHHTQQGYTMNHYAIERNGMSDSAHYNMAHSSILGFPHMSQPQHPQFMPHVTTTSPPSDHSPTDIELRSPKTKAEPAAKNFNCSTCEKKFARRSDLARHGG